jgi:hypothetical protein
MVTYASILLHINTCGCALFCSMDFDMSLHIPELNINRE